MVKSTACPAVRGVYLYAPIADIHHRFDADDHARNQSRTLRTHTEVRHLWRFVHVLAATMTDHVANATESGGFDNTLNRYADIVDGLAIHRRRYACLE